MSCMEFRQKNTKFLFPVFVFIFLVIYLLTAPFLQLKSYNIMNKLTMNNKISSSDVVLIVIDDKFGYSILALGEDEYKRYVEKIGADYNACKNGVIWKNDIISYMSDGNKKVKLINN